MSTCTPPRSRPGMTLIEILIACTLLATGIFAGIGAIGNAHFNSQRRMNIDFAVAEIQNQIELMQAMADTALQASFAGSDRIYFGVGSLLAGADPNTPTGAKMPSPGVIDRVEVVDGSLRRTCLRFAVSWVDQNGPAWVEQYFFFSNRY